MNLKILLLIFGFFILFSCITLVVLLSVYYDSYTYPNDYAIVFDAGSSSTKMYVYFWKSDQKASNGDRVQVNELTQCSKSPGIDRLTSKDETIVYFNDCLQQASKLIPATRKNRTHITLAATAGMRLLNVSDSNQTGQILSYIRDHFSKTEFLYKSNDQVKIISGKEEGLFAWISANYFLDKFTTKTIPENTIGILDLGGASTQIAFVPSIPNLNQSLNEFYEKSKIYGINYNTYSYSFLCWGVNQIEIVYQTYLIIKSNYSEKVNASCFHLGTSQKVSKSSILNSNCANGKLFNYPKTIDLKRLNQIDSYILAGTSDVEKCEQEVKELFPDESCSFGKEKCSFNNVYLPEITNKNKFIAFTNYYLKITNTELLSNKNLKKNLTEYKAQTNYLCSLDYTSLSSINNQLKPPIDDKFLKSTCFFNFYVLSLYSKYKINSFDNVDILTTVNNNTIGWNLGYIINQLNRDDFLPYEAPPRKLEPEFFIPAITIISVFTLISIISVLICIFKL